MDRRLKRQVKPANHTVDEVLIPVRVGGIRFRLDGPDVDLVDRHDRKQARTWCRRLRQLGPGTSKSRAGPGDEHGAGHAGAPLIWNITKRVNGNSLAVHIQQWTTGVSMIDVYVRDDGTSTYARRDAGGDG